MPTENASKTNETATIENPEKPQSVFNYGGFGSTSNAAAKPVASPPPVEEKKKSAFGSGSAFGGYSMGTSAAQKKPATNSTFGNFSMVDRTGQGND